MRSPRAIKTAPRGVFSTRTKFAALPLSTRRRLAAKIVGGMRLAGVFGRGGYKTVFGPDQLNRRWTTAETDGEVAQLTASERNRLIALARNAARNSEHLEGILHQLEINVIGVEGGKAVFSFPAGFEQQEEEVREAFAEWAQEAEYFDDSNLQEILKRLLRTQLLGGDCVLVFDWDVTRANSGQVIAFEPDCIGNLAEADFKRLFPAFRQYQGIIKNENGKTVGAVVSWAERGQAAYRLEVDGRRAVWTLVKPDGMRWKECPFILFRGLSRFNQMRGNSRLWAGLGTVSDLADLQGFELQSAKKGAQTIGQVTQAEEQNEAQLSGELDPDASAPIEGEAAAADGSAEADEPTPLDLEAIDGLGAIYDVMPPGVKMELFDTKHPNDKLVEFSKWLHSGVAFALGLGNVHASGQAVSSYSAAMAEMLISQAEFRDEFHKLKTGFLDWLFSNWSRRAQSIGLIPQDSALPQHWRRTCVKWQEPPKRAINPVDEQNALNSGLKNGTILYREKLGPDWKTKLSAFGEEIEYCKKLGIPHPALQTVSGQTIDMTAGASDGQKKQEQEDKGKEEDER